VAAGGAPSDSGRSPATRWALPREIETALAASLIHGLPVWSALNAGMLAKFTPPSAVKCLHVFADSDTAGLEAAQRLTERLRSDRLVIDVRTPQAPAKDFADVLRGAA